MVCASPLPFFLTLLSTSFEKTSGNKMSWRYEQFDRIPESETEFFGSYQPLCDARCHPNNDGDTAFLVLCTTFVMLQTPAIGLTQAGIIRRKNALSMLMQSLTGIVIGSTLWFVMGFSLVFGESVRGLGIIGGFKNSFLIGVSVDCCYPGAPALTIPGVLFAGFQMMYAVVAPVVVTGAWAERMEFKAFLCFTTLWPFLVFYPLAHWLQNENGWLLQLGVLDFAGGLTIHTPTGIAALVVSTVLSGRMQNKGAGPAHHNLPMFILGESLIWGGWYSYNSGSAYKSNQQAALAVMNTHLSASAGAGMWIMLSRLLEHSKWSLIEIMNGAFAGLACITAGSGFVMPYSAIVIGCSGSAGAFFWAHKVKPWLQIDDALDVCALQGIPGIIGTMLVGVLAEYSNDARGPHGGLLGGGNGTLLLKQMLAVFVVVTWTATLTYVLMIFMKHVVGIDVRPEAEEKGLDEVQIGEQAYDETLAPILDLGQEVLITKLIDAAAGGKLDRVKSLVQVGAQPFGSDYDGRTALHLAAAGGHLEILKYLCKHADQAHINPQDRFGNTPLHDAIINDQSATVRWLKTQGARASTEGGYVRDRDIMQAAAEGHLEEVKWRLKADPNCVNMADYDRRRPLHVAASEGHFQVIKALLRAKANPQVLDRWGLTPYASAVKGKHTMIAKELRSRRWNSNRTGLTGLRSRLGTPGFSRCGTPDVGTPLLGIQKTFSGESTASHLVSAGGIELLKDSPAVMELKKKKILSVDTRSLIQAADVGDLAEVTKLLNKGSDPNEGDYDNRTPLHLSASTGHLEIVQLLIAKRANLDVFDRFGRTPFMDAIDMGYTKIAKCLRNAGATISNPTLAKALCTAAALGDLETIEQIELTGGNLACSDYDGRTAMHLAASEGQIEVIKWMLSKGVRPNPRDRWGGTPLDDAKREGHEDVEDVLAELEVDTVVVNFGGTPMSGATAGGLAGAPSPMTRGGLHGNGGTPISRSAPGGGPAGGHLDDTVDVKWPAGHSNPPPDDLIQPMLYDDDTTAA